MIWPLSGFQLYRVYCIVEDRQTQNPVLIAQAPTEPKPLNPKPEPLGSILGGGGHWYRVGPGFRI